MHFSNIKTRSLRIARSGHTKRYAACAQQSDKPSLCWPLTTFPHQQAKLIPELPLIILLWLLILSRMFRWPLLFIGRSCFFLMGFHRVKVEGKQATCQEAPILIAAPHTSFFDIILGFLTKLPSGVAAVENTQKPILGSRYPGFWEK